jgi:hypothetical protein
MMRNLRINIFYNQERFLIVSVHFLDGEPILKVSSMALINSQLVSLAERSRRDSLMGSHFDAKRVFVEKSMIPFSCLLVLKIPADFRWTDAA